LAVLRATEYGNIGSPSAGSGQRSFCQQPFSPKGCYPLRFWRDLRRLLSINTNTIIVQCHTMSNEKSTIAKNIKRLRKQRGLSQDKLSKLADISHNTIIKIESGSI